MSWPWSWVGPSRHRDARGTYYEMRIRELSDFFVAGRTRNEVVTEAAAALRAFLSSYVEAGEVPPMPKGARRSA
jgi:predicted RNase H-like HicB family nuclease